jgi:hypothetical protein
LTIGQCLVMARTLRERPVTLVVVLRQDYPNGYGTIRKAKNCVWSRAVSTRIHREPWRLAKRLRSATRSRSIRRPELLTQEADMRRTFVALALGALVVAGWPASTPAFAQPTKTARGTVTAMAADSIGVKVQGRRHEVQPSTARPPLKPVAPDQEPCGTGRRRGRTKCSAKVVKVGGQRRSDVFTTQRHAARGENPRRRQRRPGHCGRSCPQIVQRHGQVRSGRR